MNATFQQRQVQRQVATPAMMLEMSLLGLPADALREAVKKELDANPALEKDIPRKAERTQDFAGWDSGPRSGGDKEGFLENLADQRAETLDEHIMSELRMSGVSGRELELCGAIVAELDGDGRFKGELPSMMMATGASEKELEAARRLVMSIDPKGCGAKDLAECFLAQAGIVPEKERAAFVADLKNLKSGKVSAATVAWLRKMDGFPGRQYGRREVHFVTPDVFVDENGDVVVDQGNIPDLKVSPKYIEMAKDRTLDDETREYAADRVKRAREFAAAVVRRRETIEKIAEFAVGGQREFLEKGAQALRRQTMSEIAKKAGCDVSTVSRAASGKYVKTPRGTVPLRRFFVLVDQAPIERLREIFESAPKDKRPSDREASEMMGRAGYPMARRTVAKYRAKLGL